MNELLQTLFGPFDRLLASVPLAAARWCALALLILPALAVQRLPRRSVLAGAPDRAAWRDLRLWALVVTTPYILIYWCG